MFLRNTNSRTRLTGICFVTFVFTLILSGKEPAHLQLSEFCHEPTQQFDTSLLPRNLRLVTFSPAEETLKLVNPYNGESKRIPNTEGEDWYYPKLFDDASKLLYIRQADTNHWVWQTMNLNGSAVITVREANIQPIIVQRLGEALLLFDEGYNSSPYELPPLYQVLDFRTAAFSYIQYPQWQYYVPFSGLPNLPQLFKFNAEATQVAYLAYPLDLHGQPMLSSFPRLTRVQDVIDNHFVDIKPGWKKYDGYFDWFGTTDTLAFWDGGSSAIVDIYDADGGQLLFQITPPDQKYDYVVVEISWSPNQEQLLVEWRKPSDNIFSGQTDSLHILALYNIQPEVKLQDCFRISNNVEYIDTDVSAYKWTPDGQFIWWLECLMNEPVCSNSYELMMIATSTNTYGKLASEVASGAQVGFDDSLGK